MYNKTDFVKSCIKKHIPKYTSNSSNNNSSTTIIEHILHDFTMYYEKPVNTIADLNSRENKKIKGDVFEELCKLYFETILTKKTNIQFYKNVWLLKEIPLEIRKELGLKKSDLGIDIVLQDINDNYYAVQVKYRTRPKYKSKNVVGWKQLSTFYALVNRTGPWTKHIIFTNADYVRHVGRKDPKDKSYCLKTLKNIKLDHWYSMVYDDKGRTINDNDDKNTNYISKQKKWEQEYIRHKRLQFYDKPKL